MELLNVPVSKGSWIQVYDGSANATLGIAGSPVPCIAQVCQSTTTPSDSLVGFTITSASDVRSIFVATSGTPVYARAITTGVVMIINA